jgi:hypothetical protein
MFAIFVCGFVHNGFMTIVDVPMYLARWHADLASGQTALALQEGMRETLARCTVVHEWSCGASISHGAAVLHHRRLDQRRVRPRAAICTASRRRVRTPDTGAPIAA